MKHRLATLGRQLGWLQFDLLATSRPTYPDAALPLGELVVVEDAGIQKWACLQCPGGCGKTISLSLNPTRRPRWGVRWDFWNRPTIEPSVHQTDDCGCHFWIRQGRIDWCKDGRPRRR